MGKEIYNIVKSHATSVVGVSTELQKKIWRKSTSAVQSQQCPFNAKYVPVLKELAKEKNIKFKAIQIKSGEEAKNAPTLITTYALFFDGEYVTNEQMNDKRFLKLISQ